MGSLEIKQFRLSCDQRCATPASGGYPTGERCTAKVEFGTPEFYLVGEVWYPDPEHLPDGWVQAYELVDGYSKAVHWDGPDKLLTFCPRCAEHFELWAGGWL